MDSCPGALEVKNQLGERGSLVLEELQAAIGREEMGGDTREVTDGRKDTREDDDDDEDNNVKGEWKWKEKLLEEHEFETRTSINGRRFEEKDYWRDEEDERGKIDCMQTLQEAVSLRRPVTSGSGHWAVSTISVTS